MNGDYWPTQDWRRADPETVGMQAEILSNLDKEIETRYRSITAFLVVRRGRLVFEKYYRGVSQDDTHLVYSVTKSFISALTGIAIDQGYIEGVHQRVLDFFPEHIPGKHEHLKRQMTVRHLLTMTVGFQWRAGLRAHELLIDRMRRSKDWVAFILDLPIQERWFGRFQYSSAASHLLSAIITRSTGMCAQDFAAEHLFAPVGIEPPAAGIKHTHSQADVFSNTEQWPKDPQGNSIGGWGLVLKPRDMARFGYLYLKGGQWDGEQVIPEKWCKESVEPHTPGYGYQWWLREVNDVFVFSADGRGGNHIYCLPEQDLVVVVASRPGDRWRNRRRLLEEYLIPAAVR